MKVLIGGFVMWAVVFIVAIAGWIANIVKLIHHVGPFDLLEVCRCVGIIAAPLGVVLGYFF